MSKIKTIQLAADCLNPIVTIDKTWPEPCVFLGDSLSQVFKVSSPSNPIIPLYAQTMGPLSQKIAAVNLRRVAPFTPDIFILEVTNSCNTKTYGMVAVPRNTIPIFNIKNS